MPPVISKPDSPSFSQLQKELNTVYVDRNLAHIISTVVSSIKSGHTAKSKSKKPRACKFPCSVCGKNVNKHQKAIACSKCLMWSHASCNGVGKSEYSKLMEEDDELPWYCLPCLILSNSEVFPFGFLSKPELCDLLGVDLPSLFELLPSYETVSKLTKMPDLDSFDLDENLILTIDSKYYKVQELNRVHSNLHVPNFSLFHVNKRSLSKHFDELHSLLYSTKIPFDVIGVTETKQLVNKDFLTNVNIEDYQLHTQPTRSSCGGVAMYIKKALDHKILHHLNALEDEFETLWVEINTGTKRKNIVMCCAYRHPDTDNTKFIEYLEATLSKVDKSKIICVIGDFNINLLNYESHSETNEFINSMVSHYLLPHILQPTRVTDHSATIIDDIFTNRTEFSTVNGNILNQLADHFSQFLVIKKLLIPHNDAACYQYDYSNFDKNELLADFSKINWNDTQNIMPDDVNEEFSIFHEKVSKCVRNHVPLIKLGREKISLHSKHWISVRIEQMIAKRDKYLRKFNRTKSLDMEYLYKKFRNKVV